MNKMKELLLLLGAVVVLMALRAQALPVDRSYRVLWTCTPITTYLGFSCFAYRDDTGEVIFTKQLEATRKVLGMPVGTKPELLP